MENEPRNRVKKGKGISSERRMKEEVEVTGIMTGGKGSGRSAKKKTAHQREEEAAECNGES